MGHEPRSALVRDGGVGGAAPRRGRAVRPRRACRRRAPDPLPPPSPARGEGAVVSRGGSPPHPPSTIHSGILGAGLPGGGLCRVGCGVPPQAFCLRGGLRPAPSPPPSPARGEGAGGRSGSAPRKDRASGAVFCAPSEPPHPHPLPQGARGPEQGADPGTSPKRYLPRARVGGVGAQPAHGNSEGRWVGTSRAAPRPGGGVGAQPPQGREHEGPRSLPQGAEAGRRSALDPGGRRGGRHGLSRKEADQRGGLRSPSPDRPRGARRRSWGRRPLTLPQGARGPARAARSGSGVRDGGGGRSPPQGRALPLTPALSRKGRGGRVGPRCASQRARPGGGVGAQPPRKKIRLGGWARAAQRARPGRGVGAHPHRRALSDSRGRA